MRNVKEPEKAGLMCMADGKAISLVEIINLLIGSYRKSGGKGEKIVRILLILDSCFAGGQYLDLCAALQRGEIQGHECLKFIEIFAACSHDEISFGNESGGTFTQKCCQNGWFSSCEFKDKEVINGTDVFLWYP